MAVLRHEPRIWGLRFKVVDGSKLDNPRDAGESSRASAQYHFATPFRILLVAAVKWESTSRLAAAFAELGCDVAGVCPRRHPMLSGKAVCRGYPYSVSAPVASLLAAIEDYHPDLIVPCDDRTVLHLLQLYHRVQGDGLNLKSVATLLDTSLGAPLAYPTLMARRDFMDLARFERIRVPQTEIASTGDELKQALKRVGLPAYLKMDGSWGGLGSLFVATEKDALRAFDKLISQRIVPLLWRTARQRGDLHWLAAWPNGWGKTVNVQKAIAGTPANSTIACWKGDVLARIHVDVLQEVKHNGPASVIERVDCPDMEIAAQRLARRFGLSGLHGLDYVREHDSGKVYLIEFNPRATQVAHLALGNGHDLCNSLVAAASGAQELQRPAVTGSKVIALFPNELNRDRNSIYLKSAYHDVPAAGSST